MQIAVTGAASGMGLCISQILASRGAAVSLGDINQKGLESAVATLGGNGKHITTVVDVTKSVSVDAWIEKTVKELGALHGAVNFAGILKADTLIKDESDESWDRMMNINARGIFFCIRAQLKHIQKGGSIVSWISTTRNIYYTRSNHSSPLSGICRHCEWFPCLPHGRLIHRQQARCRWFNQSRCPRES